MPMLAERRRKTKWMLNPGRRALWNNDESSGIKFGQGLMEKMGWKVGQGLGANKQGITEPLRISMKSDCKGIGFKDTDSIEWIQQQHDFNELLGKLSSSNKTSENECNNVEAVKIKTSLEEKSKHSKTRVHYHKFTRGKDLSKYSEKDLECIVGSKKELAEYVVDQEDSKDSCSKPETDQSLTYAGSMVDYFSKKLQTKQNDRQKKLTEYRHREHSYENFHGNENERPECTSLVKEKRQKVKEIKKTCNGLLDSTSSSSKYFENHNSHATVINSNVTHDDMGWDTNYRKKCLNVVSNGDCSQDLNDGRYGEGEADKEKIKDIREENVSGNDSEYKHLKKHKKKKKEREAKENNLESVDKLDNSVIDCKKRKFDFKEEVEIEETIDSKMRKVGSKGDEISREEISKPWKKKKRKEEVEETDLPVDLLESKEVNHSNKKQMDNSDVHFEDVATKPKVSGKDKAKKTEINLDCGSQLEIEEWKHRKSKKIKEKKDEYSNENVEELLKSRKKKKRKEKVKEMKNNLGVDQLDTEEVSHSKRKKMDDNVKHCEEVSRQWKKEKTKKTERNLRCDSLSEIEVEHCEIKKKDEGRNENFEDVLKPRKKEKRKEKSTETTTNLECDSQAINKVIDYKKRKVDGEGDEVRSEELSKTQKKEKRKERRKEIENADVSDECIHAEGHRRKSKKKKRSREEGNLIEGDEIKQEYPDCNMTNVDPATEEKVPMRQGKGSSTNDTSAACDMKEKKRRNEKDECNNDKGKKENDKKEQLKPGDPDPYKTVLLEKGSAYGNSRNKILDLICCINVNAFRGSNLKHLQGYGIIRYLTDGNV